MVLHRKRGPHSGRAKLENIELWHASLTLQNSACGTLRSAQNGVSFGSYCAHWAQPVNKSVRIVKHQAHEGTLEVNRLTERIQQLLLAAPRSTAYAEKSGDRERE